MKVDASSVPRFRVGLAIAVTVIAPNILRAGEPNSECPAGFPIVMRPEHLDCPYHGFIIRGAVEGGGAGFRVSSAGDINNDGHDDLLVATGPTYPPCSWQNAGCEQGTGAGEAYVIFGDPSLISEATFDLADLNGVNGFRFTGLATNEWFGLVVASVGDINNDGVDDVAISNVEGQSREPVYIGHTYIVFGGTQIGSGGTFDLTALDGTNGFVARGLMSGYSVAAAGDIDADGVDDLLIGAPTITPPSLDVDHLGRAYLIFGGAGDWPAVVELDDLAGSTGVNGSSGLAIEARDEVGSRSLAPRAAITVAGLGDVNADGADDLIVGVKGANIGAGECYVIFGGAGDWPEVIEAVALAGKTGENGTSGFIAPGWYEGVGWAVSSAGDLNDDGISDLLIGAPGWISVGRVGRGYVVFGSPNLGCDGEFDLLGLNGDNGFVIEGDRYGDEQHMGLGSSLSVAGDLNGDGVNDVVLGTAEVVMIILGTGELFVRDEAFVVFGGADVGASGLIVITELDGSNGFRFEGSEEPFDRSETSRGLGPAGDLNGDGFDDIVIGAPNAGSAGEAYVLWGCPPLGGSDCNDNYMADACETDCNDNGVPDECDVEDGTSQDCNLNNILDECDLSAGTSEDSNQNDVPDECEPDCNHNNIVDELDLAEGTSDDCNQNGVPDECEPDCNNNGVADECDIDEGTSEDCNGNAAPDTCDLVFPPLSFPQPLNTNAAFDSGRDTSSVTVTDGSGTWVAVWSSADDLGGTIGFDWDILIVRSEDGGLTWTDPVPLNTNAWTDGGQNPWAGSDLAPQIATDGIGNWIAVWQSIEDLEDVLGTDGDILYARSADNGLSWTAPAPLNTNAATDDSPDYAPQLATDKVGNWVAVWTSEDDLDETIGTDRDILYARSIDNGVTWTAPAALNNAADDEPHLATDESGCWLAAWSSRDSLNGTIGTDFDILVARSVDDGASWTDAMPLNANASFDDGWDVLPHVVARGAGSWLAVWQSTDSLGSTIGTDWDILFSTGFSAFGWTMPAPANTNAFFDAEEDSRPHVATDGAQNWVVVWNSKDDLQGSIGTDLDVLYTRSAFGDLAWSAAAPLNANATLDTRSDTQPKLSTNGTGTWVATWTSNDHLGIPIGYDDDIIMTRFELITIDCNDNGIPDDCDVTDGTSTDVNGNGIPDECECLADLDSDGGVGPSDLALLLGSWGPCADPDDCPADLDGDEAVAPFDLALLLGDWGPCE